MELDASTRLLLEDIRNALHTNGAKVDRVIELQERALKNQEDAIATQRLAVSSYQRLTGKLFPVLVVIVVLVVALTAMLVWRV